MTPSIPLRRSALCVAGLLFAALAAWPQQTQPPTPKPAPPPVFNSTSNVKARQVVESAIAALGGHAYLSAIYKSGSGRIYAFDSRGQLAGPGTVFWSFERFPDALRIELTKQRDDIYIYNANGGWEITYRGATPLKPEAMERYRDGRNHSIDLILRRWAADPSTLMQYQGVSMAAAEQVEEVAFYSAAGPSADVFFDINTHLPLRVEWHRTDPLTGVALVESQTFGNYQVFDGITTPMILQRFEGDRRLQQLYYQSMSYAPLANSLFVPTPRLPKHH